MTNAEQDIKIERIDQKVDSFKETVENFIQEMRDRDNRRDADIRELRQKHDADMKELSKQRETDRAQHEADMKEMQKKQDAVANELRTEIRDGIRHIQNLTMVVIIGIVAIVVAVIAFVWQNSSNNQPQNYQPPAQSQNYSPPQITNNSGGD